VSERDAKPALLKATSKVDEHRVAVIRQWICRFPSAYLIENLGKRHRPVLHPSVIDVCGLEAGDDDH
jgi:hypothetical protein